MNHPDYSPAVWQYFNDDSHAGHWPAETAPAETLSVKAHTPGSRAVMVIQIQLLADRVAASRFQVYGCVSAIACGAWLAQWLIGKERGEAQALSASEIDAALQLAPVKRHCALLAEDALGMLLAQWGQNNEAGASVSEMEATG